MAWTVWRGDGNGLEVGWEWVGGGMQCAEDLGFFWVCYIRISSSEHCVLAFVFMFFFFFYGGMGQQPCGPASPCVLLFFFFFF